MRELKFIIERMRKAAECRNDVELTTYLGLKSKGAISTWKSRGRIPYAECDIISQKESIYLDWLLTGQGEMSKSKALAPIHDDLVYIPEYDVELSAGFGAYPEDHALAVGNRPFSLKWLRKKGLKAKDLQLVRVKGDSMEPLLKDKDLVMLDTSKTKPSQAMPFAVRLDDDLMVKTIQHQGDGSIALISHNKTYNDIIIDQNNPPHDFQIIGAVVWHAHSWI
ncbi:MAG: helix-turn-helix domain-containing protein [Mariprofundus sp.]|nr:helix-turn-helix domain-containing protein [Mariprofundus sp.]